MKAAIGMEILKTKGRKIWLVVAVMMAVQLLWAGWAISNKDADDLIQGWMFFLYQFPMLNCIIMPVIAAVVSASSPRLAASSTASWKVPVRPTHHSAASSEWTT